MLKNRKIRGLLVYSLLFLLLGGALVFIFAYTGRSMIGVSDASFQHFPVLCYIRSYIRQIGKELLQNHRLVFPMVDFRIGQGMDVLTTLNYYGFGDPLTCISAFFPENCMAACYGLLILLRIYLCGAVFLLYCFEVKTGEWISAVAGAIAYDFGTFTLWAGFKHPFFLNGPLYLSILLLGIERAIRRKKYLSVSVFTALCLISNFYFAYMNTILAGCYLLIRLFWMRERPVKERLCCLMKLAFAYICGMGLSAAVFLPVVYAFANNGRVGGETGWGSLDLLFPLKQYKEYFEQLIIATKSWSVWTCFGFSALFLPAVAALFVHKVDPEQKRWQRPLRTGVLLCAVLICFPLAGKVMNGFTYVSNRWFYAGAFAAALTVTYLLPELLKLRKAEFAAVAGVSLLYAAVVLLIWNSETDLYRIAVLCCVFAALLVSLFASACVWRKRPARFPGLSAFLCLAVASAGLHICGLFFPQFDQYIYKFVPLSSVESQYEDAAARGMPLLGEEQNEEFARIDREPTTMNSSLLNGLKCHNFYFSMSPAELTEFYRSLSLNTLQFSYLFRGHGGRTILDEITATKYYATTEAGQKWAPFGYSAVAHEDADMEDGAVIMKNDYFLPLGFTYSSYVSRKAYEELAEEKRQQLLLQSAVLETDVEGIAKKDPGDLAYSVSESEVTVRGTKGVTYKNHKLHVSKKKAKLKLDFEAPPRSEVYLMLKGIRSVRKTEVGMHVVQDGYWERLKVLKPDYKVWSGHDCMLINLGYSEEARTGCTLVFSEKMRVMLEEIRVFSLGMENYAEQVKALGEDTLQKTEVKDNRISGEITLDREKLLYLSVPYSKGWSAYVDGEKADILKANLTYMALALGEGTHSVVLRYETPCLRLGMLISALTALGMTTLAIFGKRRLAKREKTQE